MNVSTTVGNLCVWSVFKANLSCNNQYWLSTVKLTVNCINNSLNTVSNFKRKLENCKQLWTGAKPPRANRTPRIAEPTEIGPKGWRARGKSEDTGQRLSRGICCNGKCTGSAKGWMCAYLDLFNICMYICKHMLAYAFPRPLGFGPLISKCSLIPAS